MTHTLAPLYIWSGDGPEWGQAIAALGPGDIAVVTGPSSGPPDAHDPVLAAHIDAIHAKGARAVGYVATGFGVKPWRQVVDEAARWHEHGHDVDGPFFDEIKGAEPVGDLRGMHGYGKSMRPKSGGLSIFNPGRPADLTIRNRMLALPGSIWITFEGPAASYAPAPSSAREAHLVYEAVDPATMRAMAERVRAGYCYATPDGRDGNPWNSWQG